MSTLKKWVKAIICGCLFYEFGEWFGGVITPDSPEWIQLLIRLTAMTMAVLGGVLMVMLFDKEDNDG